MNPDRLRSRLAVMVARGLVGAAEARRVALLGRLVPTFQGRGSDSDAASAAAVSGETLARSLGLSRAAVHKHVEHLRGAGLEVMAIGGGGYRLSSPWADSVAPEAALLLLLEKVDPAAPWIIGLPYRYLARCESTNLILRQEAATLPSGTTVVTDEQTGGRGRLGRTWISQSGRDLTFSVLLRPPIAPAQAHLVSLAAAVAMAEVLETLPGLEDRVRVKWPNDVLVDGKKVCGVLVEGSMDADRLLWAIVGIGLNVNSDASSLLAVIGADPGDRPMGRPEPTSLQERLDRMVPRGPLLVEVLCRLRDRFDDLGSVGLLDGIRERDALAGRQVKVLSGLPEDRLVVEGVAAGIGPEGQLLVKDDAGTLVPVFAGEATVNHSVEKR